MKILTDSEIASAEELLLAMKDEAKRVSVEDIDEEKLKQLVDFTIHFMELAVEQAKYIKNYCEDCQC